MNILNRLLLIIYTFGVMVVMFVLGLVTLGWTTPLDLLQIFISRNNERIIIGFIVVAFLIISLKFFIQALSSEKMPAHAVVQETGMGQVRVSVDALENLVYKVTGQIKGVREVKTRVACYPEGVSIFIRVILSPEVGIPQTSDEIQTRVKDYITEIAGIKVQSVKILVEDISSDAKAGNTRKLT